MVEPAKIIAAALRNPRNGLILSLPSPARHHTIMHLAHELVGDRVHSFEQGFVTSESDYVPRSTALDIARDAGQLKDKHGNPDELYSEDLW